MTQKHDNDKRFAKKYFFKKDSKSVLVIVYSSEDEMLALKFKDHFAKKHNVLLLKIDIYENLVKVQNITHKDDTREILTKTNIIWEKMKADFIHAYKYMVISIGHGCWPGMQLVMRRHECKLFASINPDLSYDDFLFFTPAPCSGIILYKDNKHYKELQTLYDKMIFKNSGRDVYLENVDEDNIASTIIKFFDKQIETVFTTNLNSKSEIKKT